MSKEIIIDLVCIHGILIATPQSVAVCECQTLQLNNKQIKSGRLSHTDAHYQFSNAH